MNKELPIVMKLKPKYKFWLETEDGYVFGQGSFKLLKGIKEKGTLSNSARDLNMSYRHAWGILKQIEKRIGKPVLVTYKGGKSGGGGAALTQTGKELLESYLKFKKVFDKIVD